MSRRYKHKQDNRSASESKALEPLFNSINIITQSDSYSETRMQYVMTLIYKLDVLEREYRYSYINLIDYLSGNKEKFGNQVPTDEEIVSALLKCPDNKNIEDLFLDSNEDMEDTEVKEVPKKSTPILDKLLSLFNRIRWKR